VNLWPALVQWGEASLESFVIAGHIGALRSCAAAVAGTAGDRGRPEPVIRSAADGGDVRCARRVGPATSTPPTAANIVATAGVVDVRVFCYRTPCVSIVFSTSNASFSSPTAFGCTGTPVSEPNSGSIQRVPTGSHAL
jgi:hypothetical protein